MADTSVDEITIKANRVTDESADSCRRILQMTEEVKKLRNVKQEVGQIEQDMKRARKNLNELSKCCGLCVWPWDSRRYKQGKEPKESKRNVVPSQQSAIRNGQAVSAGSAAPSSPYIKRITNDQREVEMEDDMKKVGDSVVFIKSMAL
ncbi:unnamed protein product [Leuciscus chuanchicus]